MGQETICCRQMTSLTPSGRTPSSWPPPAVGPSFAGRPPPRGPLPASESQPVRPFEAGVARQVPRCGVAAPEEPLTCGAPGAGAVITAEPRRHPHGPWGRVNPGFCLVSAGGTQRRSGGVPCTLEGFRGKAAEIRSQEWDADQSTASLHTPPPVLRHHPPPAVTDSVRCSRRHPTVPVRPLDSEYHLSGLLRRLGLLHLSCENAVR